MAIVKCRLHLNQNNTLPVLLQSSILKRLDNLLPPISSAMFPQLVEVKLRLLACVAVWRCRRGWGEETSAIIEVIRADNTLGISRYRSLPPPLTVITPAADHPASTQQGGKIVPGFPLLY